VVLTKPVPRHKFAPRASAEGILLGYVSDGRDNTCMYRVWLPSQGRAISVVDVQVLEPSHLRTPQVPRLSASSAPVTPLEHSAVMARESDCDPTALVPSVPPPAVPVVTPGVQLGVARAHHPQVYLPS
jgi:hypothetical protein